MATAQRSRWWMVALLAGAVGCDGYGGTQDPSVEPAGPHATGILSIPDASDLKYVGHAAADDTTVYAFLSSGNNDTITRSLWKVPTDGTAATMIWAPAEGPEQQTGHPWVAVGSDAVYWARGAPVTAANTGGCEVWRRTKDLKSPAELKWTASTGSVCRPVGLVVSGPDLALATTTQQCGNDTQPDLDCGFGSVNGSLARWPSNASANPTSLKTMNDMVAGYLDSAVVADDTDMFWFEAKLPDNSGPNWNGGSLYRMSKGDATKTPHEVMKFDLLSYPIAIALSGAEVYVAFAPPSAQNSNSPGVGCLLAKAPKAGAAGGMPTTILSDKTRMCVGLHMDGTNGYYASQWLEKPDNTLQEALGRIPAGAGPDAGALPKTLLLYPNDLRIRTVLPSGTDLVLVTQYHIAKLPKSMIP